MRSETKVGVVVGLVVVVAASFYIWRSRSGETDLIVSLTPRPGTAVTPIAAPAQPVKTAAATPAPSPAPTAKPLPTPIAASPTAPRQTVPPTPAFTPGPAPGPTPVLGLTLQPPTDLASMAKAEPARPGSDRSPMTPDRPETEKVGSMLGSATPIRPGPTASDSPIDRPATPPALASLMPRSNAAPSEQSSPPVAGAPPTLTAPGKPAAPSTVVPPATPADRLAATPNQPTAENQRHLPSVDSTAPREWPKYHRVERGETLVGLSRAYYGDAGKVDLILAANPEIADPRAVRIGARLTIPSPMPAASAGPIASEPRPVSLIARAPTPAPGQPDAGKPSPPATGAAATGPTARSYTVRSGDTLYSIAEDQLGASRRWKDLFELNRQLLGGKPDRLRPGMVLTLPADAPPPAGSTTPAAPVRR